VKASAVFVRPPHVCLSALLLALLSAGPSQAQTPTPSPEALPLSLSEGQTLTVQAFRFEGLEGVAGVDEAWLQTQLQAEVAPYLGLPLNLRGLEQAAQRVTHKLHQLGWPLARAVLPRQDARAGSLRIQVLLGRAGQLRLENASRVEAARVQAFFQALAPGELVTQPALERALWLVGDLPGAALPQLTLAPGSALGSTDFVLSVPAGPSWSGYLLADNQGSAYTGKNRVTVDVNWQSPLGWGDRLSLHGLDSQAGDLQSARLAYSLPVGAEGWRAELAAAHTTYALGGLYEDLGATGIARSLDATLSYPVQRSREGQLLLSLNLAGKHLNDEVQADEARHPKTAQVATLGLQQEHWGQLWGTASRSTWGVSGALGQLHIGNAAQRASNQAGANTVGTYARLNLNAGLTLDLTPVWQASANAVLQKALRGKNLDPSEQMNLAGASGVRSEREAVSGDNGWLLSAELRRSLPSPAGMAELSHGLLLLADSGRVFLQDARYTSDPNGTRLSDVGLGYQLRWQSVSAKLQWAQTLGPRPEALAATRDARWLLQAAWAF